ncbi:MAG: ABC transporter ATP-binding protein [Alphaproteobacteria bacterium]|nr:ABC transporter ATP-binding protein [Alphaproteobacteria bacterium]MCB9930294.1 ABC transporter ATP-binding protein [Alphaproteobacteria bacterium]
MLSLFQSDLVTAPDETAPGETDPAGKPLVSVRNLRVRFATRAGSVAAVNGVNFDVQPGRVLCILGESGSGKSVTMRAIAGILPKATTTIDGRIDFDGTDLVGLPEAQMRDFRGARISMIFQEPMTALDPVFTVGSQIAESIVRHEGVSWRDARARALELLELVQIPSAARRMKAYPHEMSGGMRQRAMIALALACKPDLLLADEPTTALDVTVQIQIVLLLRELQRELGMAVMFVTHDVGVAAEIADELAVMYAGRFVEHGPAVDVIERPLHPYTAGLLASTVHGARRGSVLQPIPGMPPDLTRMPPGCAFAPRCPHAEAACREAVPATLAVDRQTVACRRQDGPSPLGALAP